MIYPNIFLLGRPGCGKSLVFRMFTEKLKVKKMGEEFIRMDDFPVLKEILEKDNKFERHIRKDGGFAVTDWTVVDDVLKELDKRVRESRKDGRVIFVEFARNDYAHALKNFKPDVLSNSVVFYIYSTFEECLKRNIDRFEKAEMGNPDDHIVPEELMKAYYRTDDFENVFLNSPEDLRRISPCPVFVIDSSKTGAENLKPGIEKVFSEYDDLVRSFKGVRDEKI